MGLKKVLVKCKIFRVTVAQGKREGPSTRLVFLGIVIGTRHIVPSLSPPWLAQQRYPGQGGSPCASLWLSLLMSTTSTDNPVTIASQVTCFSLRCLYELLTIFE